MFKTTWYKYTYVICRAQRKLIWSVQLQHQKDIHINTKTHSSYTRQKRSKKNLFQKNFTPLFSFNIRVFCVSTSENSNYLRDAAESLFWEWGNRINVFHGIYLYISYPTYEHFIYGHHVCNNFLFVSSTCIYSPAHYIHSIFSKQIKSLLPWIQNILCTYYTLGTPHVYISIIINFL